MQNAMLGLRHYAEPEPEEARKAYHTRASSFILIRTRYPNDPQATTKFQNLNKAYETILSGRVTIEEEFDKDIAGGYDLENKGDWLFA
jgi:hypothetical protein